VQDKTVVAQLNEVKVRGAVLQAVVSLMFEGKADAAQGSKNEGSFVVYSSSSYVLDYSTNKKYGATGADGDTNGHIRTGETKRVQITFPVPPGARKVGIYVDRIGTFDDVVIQ
jgi:hypothetical protein